MQKLSTERECARIQAQRDNHKLETQWESNWILAAAIRDRVATKQRIYQVGSDEAEGGDELSGSEAEHDGQGDNREHPEQKSGERSGDETADY